MLTIAVCDDDELQLNHTMERIGRELIDQEVTTEGFSNGLALIQAIELDGMHPQIAVLDIELGTEDAYPDGIALAQEINRLLPQCCIIFLTNYLGFAPMAYDAEHVYFVLKSQEEQRLGVALKRALDGIRYAPPKLMLRSAGRCTALALSQVLYVEREGRKSKVITSEGAVVGSQSPAELLDGWEHHFIRCHQGYWVNPAHISKQESHEFVLSDGSRLPISRSYRNSAKASFFAYLRR